MLSELQQRLVRIVLSAGIDPELALAGGGALISGGLVPRTTNDLDFFTTGPRAEALASDLSSLLAAEGMMVEPLIVTPTFARLRVRTGDDECLIDVAQDARIYPAVLGSVGRTLASEELTADKMLALFSRAIGRDFVDVYFLARTFNKKQLYRLARAKDAGFDEAVFAEMLGSIGRLDREEFEVDDSTFEDLKSFFERWRSGL